MKTNSEQLNKDRIEWYHFRLPRWGIVKNHHIVPELSRYKKMRWHLPELYMTNEDARIIWLKGYDIELRMWGVLNSNEQKALIHALRDRWEKIVRWQ